MKDKFGASNKVANACSWRNLFLTSMVVNVEGFNSFKDLYPDNPFFGSIWNDHINRQPRKYLLHDGFLLKGNQLCVWDCTLREKIIQDMHGRGFSGHFGQGKTYVMIE